MRKLANAILIGGAMIAGALSIWGLSHLTLDEAFKALTVILSACGLIIAGYGINAWRRQMRGKDDYEISKRLLKASHHLRDSFGVVRNPFTYIRERDSEGKLLDSEQKHRDRCRLYDRRYKEVIKQRTELDLAIIEAEALWGDGVRPRFMGLIQQSAKLYANLHTFLDSQSPRMSSLELPQDTKILYQSARNFIYQNDDKDEFSSTTNAEIEKIRTYLLPHLR